jgi:hypothetical protein
MSTYCKVTIKYKDGELEICDDVDDLYYLPLDNILQDI